MENEENKNTSPDILTLLKKSLDDAQTNLDYARHLLESSDAAHIQPVPEAARVVRDDSVKIIEGTFINEQMVGPDGKIFSIPPNYASKSKLVEGDRLKLTITPDGSFIYKQIGPVPRKRMIGALLKDREGNWRVLSSGQSFRVLGASVSYFKGEPGDEAVILVPEGKTAVFAAIENIVKSFTPQEREELLQMGGDMLLPVGDIASPLASPAPSSFSDSLPKDNA